MEIKVMVNGLPGNMAKEIIEAVQRRGLTVVPYSLTGPGVEVEEMTVGDEVITIVKPEIRDDLMSSIKEEQGEFFTIDFTHPSAVNGNAEFYIANELPFIMGTTGGDRDKLMADTAQSGVFAVIAPNMAKQLVGMMAMIEQAKETYPGLYDGYKMTVVESHQKTKADTSGTAIAMVGMFNKMGIVPFDVDEIELVRVEADQMDRMKVPQEFLSGHAFHTYRLVSPDGTVAFEFRHNICGRSVYAEGAVDAVLFLNDKKQKSSEKTLFNMIDVLKAGAMN